MKRDSQASRQRDRQALQVAFGLTLGMTGIELITGWLTGSLSLMADAGHMLTDAGALALSLFAAWISDLPPTPQKTYGYYRTEILAALANGIALWLVVLWIFVHALMRLQQPVFVQTIPMISVAVLGLLTNLLSGRLLKRHRQGNLNMEGAWLNVMSDALGSVGVIIAGLCIHWFGWTVADALAGMLIGSLIAVNSWNLVRRSVNILLEGAPSHLRMSEVTQAMRSLQGVRSVHDVHLWTITTGMDAMSGHVVVEDMNRGAEILAELQDLLSKQFGIGHTTIQLELTQPPCEMTGHTSGS